MFRPVKNILHDFTHLFFPHICAGCGTDILPADNLLCASCYLRLPETGFPQTPGNIIERIFYGRLTLQVAGSAFYFTKDSLIQELIAALKYHGKREIGFYLGKLLGKQLSSSQRFNDVDLLLPLPLNVRKQKKRGYNQAEEICKGITAIWSKPINTTAVARNIFTETQTHKDRIGRWQTMKDVFVVEHPSAIEGKHLLLIDDILTTGATIEACGNAILNIPGTKLSVATVAYTS